MKHLKYLILLVFTITISCSETDTPNENESAIIVDNTAKTKFDLFLDREYLDTYNISFLYKLPDIERNYNFTLVPSNLQNSIRMANLVKYLCLDAFKEVAPDDFLKKYFPKQLLMVGSAAFQNNGTRVIGTAEGGLKITLFELNNLDITDINSLNRLYFRTIFHEFAHILHQNIDYTIDFDAISESDYVGDDWSDNWTAASPSNAQGFITDYASKEANEDFVDLIAMYLTTSISDWNTIISDAGDGGPVITQKLEIVKNYMQTVWSINLDDLKDEVQSRSNNLSSQDLDNID